jgi:Flp pilus assembly protein TadB
MKDVVGDVVSDVQEIVRSEVRLARAEIREEATKAAAAGKLAGIAGVLALYAFGFLLAAVMMALQLAMPAWLAGVCVALACALPAYVLWKTASARFRQVKTKPEKTIETVKENLHWNRNQNA